MITGHQVCHTLSGDMTTATSPVLRQAFVLGSDGSYESIELGFDAAGRIELNIPDGVRYLLQVSDLEYFETDQRAVDITTEVWGRCDPLPSFTEHDTPITMTLETTDDYTQGSRGLFDSIDSVSFSTDFQFNGLYSVSPDGRSVTENVMLSAGFPLIDASAGDDWLVLHHRTELIQDPVLTRSASFTHVREIFTPSITLHDGQAATVTGAFQPVIANRMLSFTSDRAKFDADYGGLITPATLDVAVLADPRGYGARGTGLAWFQTINNIEFGASRVLTQPWTFTNVAYTDPLPDAWKRTLLIDYVGSRSFRMPSGAPTGWEAVNEQRVPFTGTIGEVGPALHPPVHPLLAGADLLAGGKITFDGNTPVMMSWQASEGADYYDVAVIQLLDTTGAQNTIQEIATLRTTQTQLALPPQLFTAGAFYTITLAATTGPADFAGGHIARFEELTRTASVISGRLRFIATCGDGVVQNGEDCDDGGESAGCNVDCTKPMCGDGLRNAAAGEACDTGGDTPSCNATCVAPQCGDGYVNMAAGEECDEGSLNNDAGHCTTACKLHPVSAIATPSVTGA